VNCSNKTVMQLLQTTQHETHTSSDFSQIGPPTLELKFGASFFESFGAQMRSVDA
jgi:hypothetical protein